MKNSLFYGNKNLKLFNFYGGIIMDYTKLANEDMKDNERQYIGPGGILLTREEWIEWRENS